MKKHIAGILGLVLLLSMLAACGQGAQTRPENAAESTQAAGGVAGAEDMTEVVDVVEEGMTPVYADSLNDGVYEVEMKSSSSMFKVERCELSVSDDEMTATLYMTSDSYAYMFDGTAAQAAAADEGDYIPLSENSDGTRTFTLPVEALDAGVTCAAFSRRKELWYDRTLLFRADSLPLDAFRAGVVVTADSLGLADGTYTVEVTLEGGSGKASVTSPARMTAEDGACTVRLEWSSPNYDYMVVDGEKYLPVNTEGNSVFIIPVAAFDYNMPVSADTTAMSQPYEIEYTLYFYADTIAAADESAA